jgi:hypothetical protein
MYHSALDDVPDRIPTLETVGHQGRAPGWSFQVNIGYAYSDMSRPLPNPPDWSYDFDLIPPIRNMVHVPEDLLLDDLLDVHWFWFTNSVEGREDWRFEVFPGH